MNIAEIQFALDKHGFRLIDKLENGELLVREKTPQEKMKHKDGIEEEEFYRAWNAGQVSRVSDGQIMNPQIKDAPSQRPWVGLTEDEIKGTWAQLWYDLTHGKLSTPDNEVRNNVVMFGQALEAKLKEKNNG
jgi:hypothetical protein